MHRNLVQRRHLGAVLLAVVLVAALVVARPVRAAQSSGTSTMRAQAGWLSSLGSHTCAIQSGDVRCWGIGTNGELGYGNTTTIGDNEAPNTAGTVDLGAGHTATAIAASSGHTCAILDDGTVRCWGAGSLGRLGYGNTTTIGDNETPGSVGPVDLGTGRTAIAITAGVAYTCAILDDGTVRCWGDGFGGELGYGNTNNIGDDETPGSVGPVDLGTGRTAIAIAANGSHTCAVLDDGTVRCWGSGANGKLGYGNTNDIGDNETPGTVGPVDLGTGRTATAIAAGGAHTCAVLDDGTVRCWGTGTFGRLGYGNTNDIGDNETPGTVGPVDLGTGRTATAIAAGGAHTCARLDDGTIRCWGISSAGQLGYGNTTTIGDDELPSTAGPVNLGGTALIPPSAPTAPPGAPTGLAGTAGDGRVSLSWSTPVGGAAATGYRVAVSPTTGVTGGATRTTASTTLAFTGLTNGTAYTFSVQATNAAGSSRAATSSPVTPAVPPPPPPLTTTTTTEAPTTTTTVPPAPRATVEPSPPNGDHPGGAHLSDGSGSWSVDRTGKVTTTGTAEHEGDAAGKRLRAPIAGIDITPSRKGYWLVGEDGGVFAYGDAGFYGSLGSSKHDAKVVDLLPSADGKGYLLVDAKGRVYAFGDAERHGDRSGKGLAAPIVSVVGTSSGKGYWLLGADGGVFAYGDAQFHGAKLSPGRKAVQLVPTDTGRGYWIVDDRGDRHPFGDAT